MDFAASVQYLLGIGHETLAIKLGLDNIEHLLASLGNPQKCAPAVQIAGTNGKGSVAAMLAAICGAARINCGLYTSPHLVSPTERIRIGGEQISEEDFARAASTVRAHAAGLEIERGIHATFFEQITAMALTAFSEARVELMILETGLGGRLDATTAAGAQYAAITQIDFDHQEYLGNSLREIAAEKAAIIRPTTLCAVIAPLDDSEVTAVINERLVACRTKVRRVFRDAQVSEIDSSGKSIASLRSSADFYRDVRLSLRGAHQLANAAVAIETAEALREEGGFDISHEAIIRGLERAVHPGRLDYFTEQGAADKAPVLFDGAHNAAGARALAAYLAAQTSAPVTLIYGAMRDKQLDTIAATLLPHVARVFLTAIDNPRAAEPEALRHIWSEQIKQTTPVHQPPIEIATSIGGALQRARAVTDADDLICITGSLYLIGEAKRTLETKR